MGTPGLKLIQDLLAKSVAKWSGEAIISTEEKKKSIKIEENVTKVEYIETESDAHDIKTEQDKIKCENPNIKVEGGLKRKLVEAKTDEIEKMMKAHSMSNYGACDSEADFCKEVDLKDGKGLIMKLLENSAAKYTVDGDDNVKFDNIQIKKTYLCKKEIDVKSETIDNLKMDKVDLVSTDVKKSLSYPVLKNYDNSKQNVTGQKREKRTNGNLKSIVSKNNDVDKHKMSKKTQKKTNFKRKLFTCEEDEILKHAIDTDNINTTRLAKQLGRDLSSIRIRIGRLKMSDRKHVRKDYSLVEDMLIMDRMLEKLPGKRLKDLEMVADETSSEFVTALGRTRFSTIAIRWGSQPKPWILQYYAGTLNLDIKRQLANFLADTFTGVDTIDWSVVGDRPEFAGHTLTSLKNLFYSNLFPSTKNHQNLEPSEVTLRNIVENTYTEHGLRKKVPAKVLTRQMEVIDYFEQYVRKHGITNFL